MFFAAAQLTSEVNSFLFALLLKYFLLLGWSKEPVVVVVAGGVADVDWSLAEQQSRPKSIGKWEGSRRYQDLRWQLVERAGIYICKHVNACQAGF